MKEFIKRALTAIFLTATFGGAYLHSMLLFMLLLGAVFLVVLCVEWPGLVPFQGLEGLLFSLVYPGISMIAMVTLHGLYYSKDFYLPLYPFFVAWAADTGGYLVGRLCGSHKICPSISPGKSWEGLAGSVVAVSVMNMMILPRIDAHFAQFIIQSSVVILVIFSLALTVIAFLGGLFVSVLKRGKQLKDAGSVLPGHGGFLDRFDSVFAVVLVVWGMLLTPAISMYAKGAWRQVKKSYTSYAR